MGRLHVRVQPGARRTALAGWFGDHPKVAIAAPPVDGAANEALVAWVATFFGTRGRDVRIVGGATSRTKRLEVDGIDDAELLARIEAANPRPPG
ncbi:MAG: DUF167 domain-containing protein [Mycobacterium sp.]|nr:DUF167 domain-containing protein [Mycobacterium sp.]